MVIDIRFGAMAPKIKDQLASLNLRAHYKDVAEWQAHADAITRLYIVGLLPPSTTRACRRRLRRLIAAGVTQ